mmetsp:Transcript_18150/g.51197  ORF Transcript_18150/g.51197 Transcript_18150/m.51197 type:complete len:300 (+) Transcript_18150:59-958(+)
MEFLKKGTLGLIVTVLVLVVRWAEAFDVVDVPACSSGRLGVLGKFSSSSGKPVPVPQTNASSCYTSTGVRFFYEVHDRSVYSEFTQCNQPLYTEDAVELFITRPIKGEEIVPVHYYELEVSPHNVLFVTNVTNPSDSCSRFSGSPIPCTASGIEHSAVTTDYGYDVEVLVPFTLIGRSEIYRLNLFRIDAKAPSGNSAPQDGPSHFPHGDRFPGHAHRWGAADEEDGFQVAALRGRGSPFTGAALSYERTKSLVRKARSSPYSRPYPRLGEVYEAWRPTQTAVPCFHVPSAFGAIRLVQ